MITHFNPDKIEKIKGKYLVIDTNVLSDCSSDVDFYKSFFKIFGENPILIDPIVKLEFLRGAYVEKTYREKSEFLNLEYFSPMADHQDIYKKVYDAAFNIARIYSHNRKSNVPLGDILITARLGVQGGNNTYFLTEDVGDFTTLMFDRIHILTFERKDRDGHEYLQHFQLLKFNEDKYKKCLANLPQ